MPPTTTEPTEADLRALAERADAGESLNLTEPASTQGADAATDTTTEGKQSDTQTQTGAALPPGSQAPTADPQKQQAQPEKQPKPESEWARMKREQEELRQEKIRLARTWQQVQAEKARIRAIPQQQSQPQTPQGADGALAKASLEDLQELAEDYAREGNARLETRVRAEISRRQQAPQAQAAPQQAQQAPAGIDREQFLSEWNLHLAELQAGDPELTKADAPLRKEIGEVLQHPYFSSRPDGIKEAYQLAKLRLEARAAPELRKRVSQLETENKTLRAATALGGSGPESRGSATKPFDQMSDTEQVEFIRRQAAEADAFR
jgi:hypothetical protein